MGLLLRINTKHLLISMILTILSLFIASLEIYKSNVGKNLHTELEEIHIHLDSTKTE